MKTTKYLLSALFYGAAAVACLFGDSYLLFGPTPFEWWYVPVVLLSTVFMGIFIFLSVVALYLTVK